MFDRISPYAIFLRAIRLSELPPDFPRTCPSPDSNSGGYFPQASGDITVAGE